MPLAVDKGGMPVSPELEGAILMGPQLLELAEVSSWKDMQIYGPQANALPVLPCQAVLRGQHQDQSH